MASPYRSSSVSYKIEEKKGEKMADRLEELRSERRAQLGEGMTMVGVRVGYVK